MKTKSLLNLLIFSALIIPGRYILSQAGDEFESYRKLNNSEERLKEFRDSDEVIRLKLKHLEYINKSRSRHRASPVKLDILASRVANMMSREAAENSFVSHWNLRGEKPYHRYSFAGGHDHVTENAYGEWTTGKFENTPSGVLSMMKKGHDSFMAERPPADGHKKNIIDKAHNYVGIGYYLTENQFRYYEEFVNRYLDFYNVPAAVDLNQEFNLQVDTRGESYLFFLICYRENMPVPLRSGQKPRKGSYEDFSRETSHSIPAWELSAFRQGTRYNIPLRFTREGLYYIHLFTDAREIKTPGKITTKGRHPVSGIVIKVTGK